MACGLSGEKAFAGSLVGLGVLLGGTREKPVGEAARVKVGRRVGVSVIPSTMVGVQVASSWIGVIVNVGGA